MIGVLVSGLCLAVGLMLIATSGLGQVHEGFASRQQTRLLRPHKQQQVRLALGRYATKRWRPTLTRLSAPVDHSILVVGPTQSGKTSSVVIPAIATWPGPVLVASVKDDLMLATRDQRAKQGEISVLNPAVFCERWSVSLDPVALLTDYSSAKRIAHALVQANAEGSPSAESHFWNQIAAKTLGVLLFGAQAKSGSINDVTAWIQKGDLATCVQVLRDCGEPKALEAAVACATRDERQAASIGATLEALLDSFADFQGGRSFRPGRSVAKGSSTYLCAPAHEQRRYRSLFTMAIDEVLRTAFSEAQRQGGRLPHPLLVVLDEAAAIAPLPELDSLAATCASHGIVLLSVFQDLAQVQARWGQRADSIINNHRTRVLLAGSSDPLVRNLLTQSFPVEQKSEKTVPFSIRSLKSYRGVVISGSLPPIRLALEKPGGRRASNLSRLKQWKKLYSASMLAPRRSRRPCLRRPRSF